MVTVYFQILCEANTAFKLVKYDIGAYNIYVRM